MLSMVLIFVSCSEEPGKDISVGKSIDLAQGVEKNVIVLEAPDPSNVTSQRQIILPEFEKFCHVAADSVHFRWIGASNRMFPWVGSNDLSSIFEPRSPAPPRA